MLLLVFGKDFAQKDFAGQVSLLYVLLGFAAAYIIMTLLAVRLPDRHTDDYAMALLLLVTCFALLCCNRDMYFYFSIMAVLFIAGAYLLREDKIDLSRFRLSNRALWLTACVLMLLMGGFIALITVLRYLIYAAPNFDFGIFVNMFHHMKETFSPTVSCERDRLLSHFAVHVSPIYYLILPFYCLFPSPVTLQIAQAVIVASGLIPLLAICRRKSLSQAACAVCCGIYALYPAFSGGCFYDIHENCFLLPLLLWLFYFYEKRPVASADASVPFNKTVLTRQRRIRVVMLFLFALLICLVKEDAPVYVLFFAIFMLFDNTDGKERLLGAGIGLTALVYFVGVISLLNRYGLGAMTSRYSNFINGDSGLIGLITTVLRNPALVFAEMLDADKAVFFLQMLLPLAFLPLITRRPARWILIMPFLLVNLMPDYKYQHSIEFQYIFGSGAFLLYASILNIADLGGRARRSLLAFALTASCMLTAVTSLDRLRYVNNYSVNREVIETLNRSLETIPQNASVSASTFLVPHIAQRDQIYKIDTENHTEYVAIDLRYETYEAAEIAAPYIRRGYGIVLYEPDIILILQYGADTPS